METEEAPKLAVEANRFRSRSIITTTDLASFPDMVIKKPNTRTQPGLSWPTVIRQIQDPISMHTDHNFSAARCFSKN